MMIIFKNVCNPLYVIIITGYYLTAKERKGKPDNIGMRFIQLCQNAAFNSLQVCSLLIDGGRNWTEGV